MGGARCWPTTTACACSATLVPRRRPPARPGWCTPPQRLRLPGDLVRSPGDPASGDAAVDEAADGVAASLALYAEVYGRDSYDDAGATVVATVHYQRDYDNAFWNGAQLVFGDGDGEIFDRFTKPVDVLGHELTHAVTERTAGLVYEGQSGALNESLSDVFASCLKQRLLGQDAAGGRLADRRGAVPAGRAGAGAARHGPPRHGLRRPGAGQGPAARPHGRLRRHHRRQRRRPPQLRHPQPRLPARRRRDRRLGRRGRRPDLVRRADRRPARAERLRRVRGRHRRGGRRPRRRGRRGLGAPSASARPRATAGAGPAAAGGRPAPHGARASYRRLRRADRRRRGRPRGRRPARPRAGRAGRPDRPARGGRRRPHPDMYVYAFDLCGDRATVPEQHLTADLRRVADLVLGRRTSG